MAQSKAILVVGGGTRRVVPSPAAQRAATQKQRHAFKTEVDEETRRNMFLHIAG